MCSCCTILHHNSYCFGKAKYCAVLALVALQTGECCGGDGTCGNTEKHCSISYGCDPAYGVCSSGGYYLTPKPPPGGGHGDVIVYPWYINPAPVPLSCKNLSMVSIAPLYGLCGNLGLRGVVCCPAGQCCGPSGVCGTGPGYCDKGCQTNFGDCAWKDPADCVDVKECAAYQTYQCGQPAIQEKCPCLCKTYVTPDPPVQPTDTCSCTMQCDMGGQRPTARLEPFTAEPEPVVDSYITEDGRLVVA